MHTHTHTHTHTLLPPTHLQQDFVETWPTYLISISPTPHTHMHVYAHTRTLCSGGHPTLMSLRSFKKKDGKRMDIVRRVATDYQLFGTLILQDEDGSIVDTMVQTRQRNPVEISNDILRRWLAGRGVRPNTWETLVTYLREVGLNAVSDDIEEAYSDEPEPETSDNDYDIDDDIPSDDDDKPDRVRGTFENTHEILSLKGLLRATSEIGDWEGLCTNLDVSSGVMNGILHSQEQISTKKKRCLESYYNSGDANWEDVIAAIAGSPIYNERVAKKIAKKYGIDYKSIRDEL